MTLEEKQLDQEDALIECSNCRFIQECARCVEYNENMSVQCKFIKKEYEDHISWCRKCSNETVEAIIKRIKSD